MAKLLISQSGDHVPKHLLELQKDKKYDHGIYLKEIADFQKHHPSEEILSSQQQILEHTQCPLISRTNDSRVMRQCSCSGPQNVPEPELLLTNDEIGDNFGTTARDVDESERLRITPRGSESTFRKVLKHSDANTTGDKGTLGDRPNVKEYSYIFHFDLKQSFSGQPE